MYKECTIMSQKYLVQNTNKNEHLLFVVRTLN